MQPLNGVTQPVQFNRHQTFQNKVLRTITKLPRVTPTDILPEQTAMETVGSYVTRIASKFYFKYKLSDDEQATQSGPFIPTHAKHTMPRTLLACLPTCKAQRCNSVQYKQPHTTTRINCDNGLFKSTHFCTSLTRRTSGPCLETF